MNDDKRDAMSQGVDRDRLHALPLAGQVAAVALAYFVVGRLALLLAIPPGYAAPIWPAAAVALVAVLVYGRASAVGVWFGSMCMNASVGWPDVSGIADVAEALRVPAMIGLGAAGGALLGAALIRRVMGFPAELTTPRSIAIFMMLGGPLSCLVSPSVGVTALVAAGVVAPANAPFTWATWWVGDTLGVLLFSLILLPFVSGPQRIWRQRRRLLPPVLLVASAVLVALYIRISAAEVRLQNEQFREQVQALQAGLQAHLRGQLEVLSGSAALMGSQADVTRAVFGRYAAAVLSRQNGIHAISWSPIVAAAGRDELRARAQADGLNGYRIGERAADGALVPAGRRDRYAPVLFIQPRAGNEAALGFDLLSDASRAVAIDAAVRSGGPAVTAPIQLVQDDRAQPAVIVFMPVFEGVSGGRHPLGVISGVIRIRDWVEQVLEDLPLAGVALRLSADPAGAQRLYQAGPAGAADRYFSLQLPVRVADALWWLSASADQGFIAGARSYVPWSLLAGGLLLAFLLGVLLLTVTGARERAERSNLQLRAMIDELTSTQSELVEAKRLVSLGAMVSGLAHELNTPLGIAITATSAMPGELRAIEAGMQAGSLSQAQFRRTLDRWSEATRITMTNLQRAAELVRTFKSVVADRNVHTLRAVELRALIRETLDHLEVLSTAADQPIAFDFQGDAVTIETIPGSIVQLITNLYNNAATHAFDGGAGTLTLRLRAEADGAVLIFEDDGRGIAADNLGKIFEPFFTTRRGEGGTGLGLHIVHNLVHHQLGGRISVTSAPGQGTRFEVHLPRQIREQALAD